MGPAARRMRCGLPRIAVWDLFPALFIVPWLALPIVLAPSAAEAQTALACTSANTDGSYTVPFNWVLKPSGLAANTNFRLLFVTSTTRSAASTNIATYNTFVQNRAKAGHRAISDSCGNLFKVVGSTSTVDARDNTSTTGVGEAIYWLNGAKVADNYGDFYDGSWDSIAGKAETGASHTPTASGTVFTGSLQNGVKDNGDELGALTVRVGILRSGSNPISVSSQLAFRTSARSFYALSPVFKVGTTDTTAPRVSSITRQSPSTSPTNANSLTWRVLFNEAVQNVNLADFQVSGGTPGSIAVSPVDATNAYDVTASGGNLVSLTGTVTLSFANGQDIEDSSGNDLTNTTPTGTNDNTFEVDNTAPRVSSIERRFPRIPSTSPTNSDSLQWRVTFNEAVQNVNGADFQVSGTSATVAVQRADDGYAIYDVTASGGNLAGLTATVTLSFANGQNIQDDSGNMLTNTTPTGTNDNTFVVDNTAPRVTSITRQTPSSSPTNADELTWRVTFNEAVQNVNAADFQVSGTSADLAVAQVGATNAYDVTASGGNLAGLASTTVTLSFANGQDIEDSSGNALTNTTPTGTNHNTFVVNNTPTLSLSLASSSGAEGNSGSRDVNVGIVLTSTGSRGIQYLLCVKNTGTARFRTAQGNRAKDFDVFTASGSSPLGLTGAGCHAFQSSSNGVLAKLRIFGDTTAEGNETAVLELRRHSNTPADVVISPTAGTATYTITNDDGTPPVITISGGSAVTEGAGASFTVNANPAPTANLDVSVGVTQSGAFVSSSNRGAKTVTINANATSKTYTVPTVNDMVDEANGSVTVTVNNGEGYTVGSTAAATVTVNDNDTAAVNVSESGGTSVTEASGAGRTDTYTVVLATQPTHSVTITPTSDTPAAATVSPGTLTFTTTNWNTPRR